MHPGPIMKKELHDRGYFLAHVAKKTGISYGSLSKYLCGKRPFPESKIRTICLTFDIPLKIFGLTVENSSQDEMNNKEAG